MQSSYTPEQEAQIPDGWRASDLSRFLSKIEPPVGDGCAMWRAGKFGDGYGSFRVNRKHYGAHRASWLIYRGPIPRGKFVLHSCDNPACVNPAHLWIGTAGDNIRDCKAKGRNRSGQLHGELNPKAKLNDRQAVEIIQLYRAGAGSHRALALQFGVSEALVQAIIKGRIRKPALAQAVMEAK